MISHHNVISNVLQIKAFESPCRDARPPEEKTEVGLGLLPLSHIYGLVVIASASSYIVPGELFVLDILGGFY
jgi:ribosome assembly protein SQT1